MESIFLATWIMNSVVGIWKSVNPVLEIIYTPITFLNKKLKTGSLGSVFAL